MTTYARIMGQARGTAAAPEKASALFGAVLADLRSGQEQIRQVRPELGFEDVPAPRTLAPFATAVAASARLGGDDVATGRFVLLYDPAGQPGWVGPLRVIVYIHADLEPEIASDPLVGEVAWSWLTEALDARTSGYAAPSGTVTRVVTEGFGAKRTEPQSAGFELRASWSPVIPSGADGQAEPAGAGLADHLAAWCSALCSASGLPPPVAGVAALRPPERRGGP